MTSIWQDLCVWWPLPESRPPVRRKRKVKPPPAKPIRFLFCHGCGRPVLDIFVHYMLWRPYCSKCLETKRKPTRGRPARKDDTEPGMEGAIRVWEDNP